jgi:hypothetical protein
MRKDVKSSGRTRLRILNKLIKTEQIKVRKHNITIKTRKRNEIKGTFESNSICANMTVCWFCQDCQETRNITLIKFAIHDPRRRRGVQTLTIPFPNQGTQNVRYIHNSHRIQCASQSRIPDSEIHSNIFRVIRMPLNLASIRKRSSLNEIEYNWEGILREEENDFDIFRNISTSIKVIDHAI